ncbi:MAG: hypothetical protein KDK55_00370 [Chlamydiia bacterium]|nr:hypothetical protein [Chlamydiia bacterium]
MNNKGEKKLCWNCDGYVGAQLQACPYCGVNLGHEASGDPSSNTPFDSPWDRESQASQKHHSLFSSPFSVSDQEWNESLKKKEVEEEEGGTTRREMIALLLLLPGVVFFLFALALLLFSQDGILTLQWKQSFVYIYFLGSLPLLYLGWRAFK